MRKTTILLLGVLFVGGCSVGQEKQLASVGVHQTAPVEVVTKESYAHEISVIDPRENKVISVIKPDEFQSEEAYQEYLVDYARELAASIDRPMIPAKISANGELIHGQSRMILHEKELVRLLSNRSVYNKEVVLPIEEAKPNVTQETIQGIDGVVLGSFTTRFDASVKGRSFNIEKSANEINNTVLGPGDRFYFNTIVGNASKANGYQLATVIVNKEFVPGYGGGVCQTSSTLFNAVERAGLEILELHHHSKSVGYVPEGRDATVAYGSKDFKFANNRPYPIVIKSSVNQQTGTIEFQIAAAASYASN